jgi:hypothetical protein
MIKMRKRVEVDVKRSLGGKTDTARSAEVQGATNFS